MEESIRFINNIFPYLVMIGGLLFGWIKSRYQLPAIVISALDTLNSAGVTVDFIEDIMNKAAAVTSLTTDGRRDFARAELQRAAQRNGIELSDSTANLIVEWVYKRIKIKRD